MAAGATSVRASETPATNKGAGVTNWDPDAWTRDLMADIREHGRPTSGPMAGQPLLILTTTGAKSGGRRASIVTYSRDGDAYVVAGTNMGGPVSPFWLANLVADPDVTIEIGPRVSAARAGVVTGADRDLLWDRHVAELPWFAEYPKQSGRVIPMVRLTPLSR